MPKGNEANGSGSIKLSPNYRGRMMAIRNDLEVEVLVWMWTDRPKETEAKTIWFKKDKSFMLNSAFLMKKSFTVSCRMVEQSLSVNIEDITLV